MNKKRLKKKTEKELTLRQKRIIRTKEKMLLKKLNVRKLSEVTSKSTKTTTKKTASKKGGCGGCRRKRNK